MKRSPVRPLFLAVHADQAQSDAVVVRDVSYFYGQHRALDSMSLTIRAGEMVCVIGPNGSGKTTLFGLLNTRLYPQSGAVRILGYDTSQDTVKIRGRIGCVFQSPALDSRLTVYDNLLHHGHLFGLGGIDLRKRIDADLERIGLTDRTKERVKTLSGGLMRRVELARALLTDPDILIMDEPTVGLDPAARDRFWQVVQEVRVAQQVTIIYTTHWLDEAEPSDRVAIVDRGRLVAFDTMGALRDQIKGRVVTLRGADARSVAERLAGELESTMVVESDGVRIVIEDDQVEPVRLLSMINGSVESVEIARPSLADVFRRLTGHEFESQKAEEVSA